ncbi:MAG: hypothetical protein QM699_02405 [Amaricoccus sp.]|uniref:hypothetical protein n=1 Tax=Amaricoccus sp. TaxID=1872485 RepID=UPI0039E6F721
MEAELAQHIALGREIRSEAERIVATRGPLAEAAAWLAARAPDLAEADRGFREAVAVRISRIFALVGSDRPQ